MPRTNARAVRENKRQRERDRRSGDARADGDRIIRRRREEDLHVPFEPVTIVNLPAARPKCSLSLSPVRRTARGQDSLDMETPVPSKTPRRKLKRVIVKNKVSTKRLKSAINVSLNSSHNVRSLRLNNRSLAHRLESLKQEHRVAYEIYQSIQEENYSLRQRIVSLECIINDPDSYIEEQINKRLEVRVKNMTSAIQVLHDNVNSLSLNLKSFDEICLSYDVPAVKRNLRSDSLDGILSREPLCIPIPSPLRSQDDGITNSLCENDGRSDPNDVNLARSHEESHILDTSNASDEHDDGVQGQSDLAHQPDMSMILEQSAILGARSPVKQDEERQSKSMLQKGEPCTKLPKRVPTRSKEKRKKTKENEEEPVQTSVRRSRRATRILSEDEVNVIGILDIEPPLDLVSSPQLSPSSGANGGKTQDVFEPSKKDEKSVDTQPMKSESKISKKVNTVERRGITTRQGKGCNDLYIANEFALINTHQQITERLNALQSLDDETTNGREPTDGEHTVHIVEDMDLTIPVNVDVHFPHGCENSNSNMKEEITAEIKSEQQNLEEICPDAVTLQRTRPGKFRFAASRKETDGSRKNLLSQPPRARSKSKKVIAEMIEKLPQEEPKSIFDFHDKTPTQISGKEKDMSVYSLRDESSIMSPATPLGKRGKTKLEEKRIETNEKELPTKSTSSSLQGEGPFYSVKDGSDDKITVRKSRSQSRSRKNSERSCSRVKSSINGEQAVSDEVLEYNPNIQCNAFSVLGEGNTYSVPLKDDSNDTETEKVTLRKSRGRSRSRAKNPISEEQPNSSEKVSENEVRDDSEHSHKVTQRKSRGRSRTRAKLTTDKQQSEESEIISIMSQETFISDPEKESADMSQKHVIGSSRSKNSADSENKFHGEESCSRSDKISLLGDGVTYSMPLRDDSDNNEKITTRKSRGRSRSRVKNSKINQQSEDTHDTQLKVNEKDKSETGMQVSVLGDGITYSVPLKYDSDHNEKVTARKSRGRSRNRHAEEVNDDKKPRSDQEHVLVLGDGVTYSALLKDDNNDDEKVTARKSRGRSRKRQTKEEEEGQERARSRSQHKSTTLDNDNKKGRRRSKSRSRPKKRENNVDLPSNCKSGQEAVVIPDTQETVISEEKNKHDKKLLSHKKKTKSKASEKSTEGEETVNDKLPESGTEQIDKCLIEAKSPKPKTPPKSHKKAPQSKKKSKRCETNDTKAPRQKDSSSFLRKNLEISESASSQPSGEKEKESVHASEAANESGSVTNANVTHTQIRTCGIKESNGVSKSNQGNPSSSGGISKEAKKSDGKEKSMKRPCHDPTGNVADSEMKTPGALTASHKKRKELPANDEKSTYNSQEEFKKQLDRLKNLYTPDSFKTSSQPQRSTTLSPDDTNQQPADEPSRRRRAAAKCVSYTEPSLGGKLRRGDPFTSTLGKITVYKSPKALKKNTVNRDVLGSLQNYLVAEESGD